MHSIRDRISRLPSTVYSLILQPLFEFSKEDITSGAELSGATLCVIDKDGNVIETWTSVSGEKHVIKKLVVGETYTFVRNLHHTDIFEQQIFSLLLRTQKISSQL